MNHRPLARTLPRPLAARLRTFVALGSAGIGLAAGAATITINTTADTLAGMSTANVAAFNASATRSLRGAIIAVNNDSTGGHTIQLPAGTYTLTLANSTPATEEDAAATGDLDVWKAVTISGAGSATTIIQAGTTAANGLDKIFSFNPIGGVSGFAATINGVTLRHGRNQITAIAPGNNIGGAMDFDAGPAGTGSLTLTDVVFANNSTVNGDGGALALFDGGTVTLTNCMFTNNTAGSNSAGGANGGAIFVGYAVGSSSVKLNSCTINGNKTAGTSVAGSGGGIFSFNSSGTAVLELHGCVVTNNAVGSGLPASALDGGGVYAGSLKIDQSSVISGNTATRWGGGVYVSGGASSISSATINGNAAASGGGVFVNSGTTTIGNCRIVTNTASTSGPALATNAGNGGTASAANNWFGTNSPTAALFNGAVTYSPYLVLTASASPTTVAYNLTTSTVTARITTNSTGASGYGVPGTPPVAFGATLGSMNPVAGNLANGVASATFTPGATAGAGSATATVDSQVASVAITVTNSPLFTSANHATFVVGVAASFTVTASGDPAPTFSTASTLPAGVTLSSVGVLGGTATTAGVYSLNLVAANGSLPNGTQTFTLTVLSPFQKWQQDKFGSSASDDAIAGPSADPDGDGLENLLEYALGLDPLLHGATTVVIDTDTGALRLTATKNAAATDIVYMVEVSSDLTSWTTTGTTVETNTASTLRVVDNTKLTGANRRFIRLKVTKP
ncbi:MAG TPA: hypothetical protein VK163_13055 [Opitutaceae bacterium]|nr:hypothetical protein [Opitutaceae bacterium]